MEGEAEAVRDAAGRGKEETTREETTKEAAGRGEAEAAREATDRAESTKEKRKKMKRKKQKGKKRGDNGKKRYALKFSRGVYASCCKMCSGYKSPVKVWLSSGIAPSNK